MEAKKIHQLGRTLQRAGSVTAATIPESSVTLDREFAMRAAQIFATNSPTNRERLAEKDAFMLWLAWRGSDEYLVRHSGNVEAVESSWRMCSYKEIGNILEHSRSRKEEFRPMGEKFSEASLASIIQQLREYSLPSSTNSVEDSGPEVFAEKIAESTIERKETEILSSMTLVQQEWNLVIRWSAKDNKPLFRKIIELSSERLVFQNYANLNIETPAQNPCLSATRGYIRFAKRKDRLEQQRKRRLGILRWLSTQRD